MRNASRSNLLEKVWLESCLVRLVTSSTGEAIDRLGYAAPSKEAHKLQRAARKSPPSETSAPGC